jgi:hypothetical protein
MREQVEVLKNEPDGRPQAIDVRLVVRHLGAFKEDLTLVRRGELIDAAKERRLPGSGWADEHLRLAPIDLKRDAAKDLFVSVSLVNVLDLQ